MMRFLILLFTIAYLNQVSNARKSEDNIVLAGGGGGKSGCCNSGGGGALVMQNGKKGKKNEKLIIKDDALIMQNGNADGNLIMDGNNLIFKEGKKNENIIIKGSGGGCCSEDIHHKEEHIRPHPIAIPIHFNAAHTQEHRTYVPVPVHFKKKIVHHHHTKEVHHHNDELGLGESRRKDSNTDNEDEITSPSEKREERDTSSKRRSKNRKIKVRKLNLGDKLTSKEKEHLKLKRIDKRLGLGRFKLAGRMMKKIRFKRKKNSKKSNTQSKEEDGKDQESNSKENGSQQQQQENSNSDQQYEEEEEEDGKEQDDEASNSNLYEGLTNALYQNAAGQSLPGYMTTGFNSMMDIYPAAVPPSLLVPSTLPNDRLDLNKKKIYENLENEKERNLKKLINEEAIKSNQNQMIKEDQEKIKANNDLKEDSDELDNSNDDDQNLKLNNKSKSLKINNLINNESKTINQTSKNILQPIFTVDERQLTPALISLLALTTNAQQRQSLINRNALLNHQQQTLPLFTPEKTNLEKSAALLLPLIARQSQHQQHLIRIQHKKLLEQEAKQKELTKQLQQVAEHNKQNELKKNLFKEEIVGKSYIIKEPDEFDRFEDKENSRLQYENDIEYWDRLNDEKFKYDYIGRDKLKRFDRETINRLRRRKSDELNNQLEINQSKDTLNSLIKKQEQLLRLEENNKKEDDEFDAFSDFNADHRLFTNTKLRTRNEPSLFSKRMLEPEFEESKLITNVTTNNENRKDDLNKTSDYKQFQINEVKLAKNASLIVYGY